MQPEEAFFKLMRLGMRACDDCDVALDKAGWEAVYELARGMPWRRWCSTGWSG